MSNRTATTVIGVLLVLLGLSVGIGSTDAGSNSDTHNYVKFQLDNNSCQHYYQACSCTGQLQMMKSYPPQYRCNGTNTCTDINITSCQNQSS